jgi:WD40 repeat protein
MTERCGSGTWRAAKPSAPFEGRAGWVNAVAVTPDGRRAVSGGNDGTLLLWDLESGRILRIFEALADGVNAVAVSSTGAVPSRARLTKPCGSGTWRAGKR